MPSAKKSAPLEKGSTVQRRERSALSRRVRSSYACRQASLRCGTRWRRSHRGCRLILDTVTSRGSPSSSAKLAPFVPLFCPNRCARRCNIARAAGGAAAHSRRHGGARAWPRRREDRGVLRRGALAPRLSQGQGRWRAPGCAQRAHAPTFALAQRAPWPTQDPRSCHGARSARPRLDMRMRARPRLAFSQTHGRPSIPLWPTSQRSKRSQTR